MSSKQPLPTLYCRPLLIIVIRRKEASRHSEGCGTKKNCGYKVLLAFKVFAEFEGTIVPTVLDGPEAWSKSIAESRNKVLQNYGVSDTHRQREE